MAYFNALGQGRVGWKSGVIAPTPVNVSSLWTSIYSVYNADAVGSSSLKTSLVAAYNGESNTNDSFGSNNGTAQGGLTYTTGKIGNAFQFNGTTSYNSLPNDSFNNLTDDFSISFWVNHASLLGNECVFSNFAYNGTSYWGTAVIAVGNSFSFYIFNGTSTVYSLNILVGQAMSTNTWYNYVITRKASTGSKIYRNGTLLVSDTNTVNPVYNSGNIRPSIGSWNNGPLFSNLRQYYMSSNSKIDALNIWTKELTASEVIELYNSGNGAQYIGDNFYKPTTNDALNTYNGTAQGGLTYGVGKVGTAFQFNGTNAYVKPPNNSLSFTGDFSVSFWMKLGSLNQTSYIIDSAGFNAGTAGWVLNLASGNLQFSIYNNNTLNQIAANYVLTSTSVWYHVVITSKSGYNAIYINNSLVMSNTSTIRPNYISQPYNIPYIGVFKTANTQFFNGNIDSLNFWQKELTASEITELYNSGNGKQYPN